MAPEPELQISLIWYLYKIKPLKSTDTVIFGQSSAEESIKIIEINCPTGGGYLSFVYLAKNKDLFSICHAMK
jgi:hypothetical protein